MGPLKDYLQRKTLIFGGTRDADHARAEPRQKNRQRPCTGMAAWGPSIRLSEAALQRFRHIWEGVGGLVD